MVVHVLKTDPALRELEYLQVEAPRTTYLFFHDRHGHRGLTPNAMETVCIHSRLLHGVDREVSTFQCGYYTIGRWWHLAVVAQERHRQHSRIQDVPNQPAHPVRETSSGSSLQLVGGAPPSPENQEGAATLAEPPQPSLGRPHHHPQRLRQLRNEGGGGSPPSSPECLGGIDSDAQSTMSEMDGDHRHRRR